MGIDLAILSKKIGFIGNILGVVSIVNEALNTTDTRRTGIRDTPGT